MTTASRLRLTAAAALASFASLALACSDGLSEERADLSLFFTGTINGYIEPCGCVAGQIGGIDRIATYIRAERAANPDSLFVETGDLVAEEFVLDPAVMQQIPLKAKAFFSVWSDLGCSAMAVGENDLLTLGVDGLKKLSKRYEIPLLCGNLIDRDNEQVFDSYVIVERAGKKIGIFSLLAPKLEQPVAHDAELIEVAAKLRPSGLRLQPWKQRAEAIIAELLPKTDMILCASHLGFNINQMLAEAFPEIDLVFGSHYGDAGKERYIVGKTPVLISLFRGARVDRVDWWWPDESEYFFDGKQRSKQGHGKLLDVSYRAEVANNLEVAAAEYEAIQKRERLHSEEEYKLLLDDKISLINNAERAYASLEEAEPVNRFAHSQKPMHRGLRRDEFALEAIDQYHDDLQKRWTPEHSKVSEVEQVMYAGPETCTQCHPRQVEFWKATRHSFALSTLETSKQEVDAECFYCHTVGYRLPGGFHYPGRQAGYENVQCAACHGPGAAHVAGGTSYFERELLAPNGASSCEQCHNEIHDPKFETTKWRKLPLVACPQIEPVESRNPAMIKAAMEAAGAFVAEKYPRWQETIYAYLMAGLDDNALRVAESWVETRPKSKDAHLAVGRLLLGAERREESVKHFEFVTRKDPFDADGWGGLARALMHVDPERAMTAAKEALSLDQQNPGRIRLIAEILIAEGRVAAAAGVVKDFTDIFPQYVPALVDLFDDEALKSVLPVGE